MNPKQDPDSSESGYEYPDTERPASAAPTEPDLEQQPPQVRALDYSPPPPRHDAYAALKVPGFLMFLGGWLIAVIGHHMLSTALAWEIYDRTQSEFMLGLVAGVQVVPLFLLALPAGHLADTYDRRLIIAISAVGASLSSAGLAFLSYQPGSIFWMFVLLTISATSLVLGRPARSSLLPLLVPKEVFANAVTWNSSLFQFAAIGGPALAGVVVAWSLQQYGSISLAYGIDAVCALGMGVLIFFIPIRKPEPGHNVDRSLLAGFRFVWRSKAILATMSLDLFAVLLGGATWLLPVFAKEILQVGPSGYGWLRAAEAMGACIVAVLMAHLPPMKHAGRNMLLAVAGFGVATIVFGLSKSFWLSFAMLFAIGAFDQISVVVRHTLVQLMTPDPMRGRVSAVNNISIGASNELGGLESGTVAAWIGPVWSVVLGGIGTLAVVGGIAAMFPQLRKLGRLQDVTPEGDPSSGSDVLQAAKA